MKNNAKLATDTRSAIKGELLLHAAKISITAKNGIVSLTDVVDSYVKKKEAEIAAKQVMGWVLNGDKF